MTNADDYREMSDLYAALFEAFQDDDYDNIVTMIFIIKQTESTKFNIACST